MYHFVGIKGTGMSALAQILKELGYEVQGSDLEKHFFTEDKLVELGIKILPFSADNIKEGMQIIKGASFNDEHPEIKEAIKLGLPIFTYAQMVGNLTNKFKTICISGCHGKTTTTAMMSHVFNKIKGINYLIGDGTGYADSKNEYFALESCEYRRHFLNYNPYYVIITNIELDHVDYYKDIEDVKDAYTEFANKAEKMIIACGDDEYTKLLKVDKPISYYGLDDNNDIVAKNIEYKEDGISFEVKVKDKLYGNFNLPIYGKHMLLDALAVISTCYFEGLNSQDVEKSLKNFKGAKRRFSEIIIGNNVIIDDYAHHPSEIEATIKAAKQKYKDKKLITVFQPHTFSRTKEFAGQISDTLNLSDESYVMEIHPAREKQEDYEGITSNLIIDNLNNGYKITIDDADKLKNIDNTVVLFMSPNDISKLENDLIKFLEKNNKLEELVK